MRTDGSNQMIKNLNMGINKIVSVATPTKADDVAIKSYVDVNDQNTTTTLVAYTDMQYQNV